MEGIPKYSDVGGGATQKTFKQDAKTVRARMLRDPTGHLLAGFGQLEFLTLLGSKLSGEARGVHVAFMDTWDFENADNPAIAEAQDVEESHQLWRN